MGLASVSPESSCLQLPALGLQVHLQEARREAGEEPDDEPRPDQVRHRVGHGDVVQESGLLGGREIEAIDRIARRADDRRLREGARHQARRRPAVVMENLRGRHRDREARDAEDDRHRHLRQGAPAEPADELRADLVSGGEEEEIEEDDLDDRRDLDIELPDQDAREQRPDDVAEAEAADPKASEDEAHGERQEDRELGIVAEGLGHVRHVVVTSPHSSRCRLTAPPGEARASRPEAARGC